MNTHYSLYQFQVQKHQNLRKPVKIDLVRLEVIRKLVGTGLKVLDLGCYYQSFDLEVKKQGNEVFGLDISPAVVQRSLKAGIPALVCNLETDRWSIKKHSFDIVIAGEILEHLLDTGKFLDHIYRALKSDGHLILSTPNLASLGRRLLLLLGRNPEIETAFHPQRAGHIRYFVKESLFILLQQHGFQVEEFLSDVILFNQSQTWYSTKLARLFPSFGKALIIKARKIPQK